jgi:rhodanese-related sulfurtransferase
MSWKQFFIPAKNMNTEEARRYMVEHKVSDYTLLDVRQPGEYAQARIPGSVLIPLPELTNRLDELDRDKPLVVY